MLMREWDCCVSGWGTIKNCTFH